MYSLETFKCCNKHNIYFLECMFCGLLIILSKSIVSFHSRVFFHSCLMILILLI